MKDRVHVIAPDLCQRHAHNALKHFGMGDGESTAHVLLAAANALLVSQLAHTESIVRRAERDASNLTLVLAELGCLACYSPADYWKVVKILEQGPDFASDVLAAADLGREDWELPDVR